MSCVMFDTEPAVRKMPRISKTTFLTLRNRIRPLFRYIPHTSKESVASITE